MYKGTFITLLFILLFLFVIGCQKEEETNVPVKTVAPEVVEVKEDPSVCIWDDASVRAKPTVKSERVSALALGEKVVWLGDKEVDPVNTEREYLKIRLSDGTLGWASNMALVTNAKPAVAVKEAPVCIRPDLLTVTEEKLDSMDIMAVLKSEGDWLEMVGEEKVKAGWIQSEIISEKDEDIALALLARKILVEADDELMKEKIASVLNNPAFAHSVFRTVLEKKLKELAPEEIFPYEIQKLSTGLVAYYPFNGNANDESGNNFHGQVYKAYLTADISGNPNKAYFFTGHDGGYISVRNSSLLNLSRTGSISLLVNIDNYQYRKDGIYWYILGKGIKGLWKTDGFCIFYHNTDKVIYGVLENKAQRLSFNKVSFGQPTTGEWHHLVMVWDGSFLKAYVDGQLLGSPVKQTIVPPETTDNLIIGKKPSRMPDGYFNGIVDQIRLYDRALSEEEIMTLYKTRL